MHLTNLLVFYLVAASISGFTTIVMLVAWRHFGRKAECFSDDAVVDNGNLTPQEIHGFFNNYAF